MSQTALREQRKWVRRDVDFTVRMIFPTMGLKDVRSATFQLKDLSEGGAALYAGNVHTPDFFYLQFGDDRSEMMGCYVVYRSVGLVSCRFSREMKTSELDAVIKLRTNAQRQTVKAALDALFDPSPSASPSKELDSLFENAANLFR
jgi:hypothetical protein